ncbi:T7SS effector LXG polymorphic toxin [Parvimonas micra]|uniref:T7SS effector LXG polymorphic toxin n=1 Tax=Parvimonas micra TaxID=33033 RepID=UPI002B484DEA|nr:T7SS effector LXG polymorphic toxin [Parvimonas micra]MEB3059998.1 T7SS effector LXG polymorphic toxin [Parvimonas micra]MEB3067170.1 T7SS effector LXG polymorphic toxin [Parvimonas micra]
MEYKIQFEDITNVQKEISNSMAIWNNSINKLLKAIKNFSDDSSLKGETMDSIKVYLCEVHGTLLVSMQNLIQDYAYSFLLYKDGYYSIDSDLKAKLSEETFINLRKELSDSRNNFANQIDLLISTKNKVSDLISYSGNSHDTTISNYNFLISGLDTINNRIIAYEKLHQSQDLKLFKELLVSTRNFMENYSNKARDISSYQSGDLAKIDFAKELAVAFENSNRYLSNRRDIIEEAQKRDKVRWEEILAKERRNRGIKNLIVGGLTLLVGTGAIIATGGSGTPLVIAFAGKVFGTGTVAYSVSNLTEAGQDTIYGSLGDNETRAINPIRDTIFLGNNKLYHGTGHFFTIGSSILIPIGKTNSLVKGVLQYAGGSAGAWLGGKVGYYGLKGLGFSEENAKIGQVLFSMYAGYKASQIIGGFTLNKTFELDESFLKLNTKVEKIKLRAEIWLEDKFERGIEIDGLRGNNLGHNFPVIDKFENRTITSVKSKDLLAKTYQNGKKLEYTIKSDINKLIKFKTKKWNGHEVLTKDYSYKCLEVVVPNVTLSESQINCINNAIEYAEKNNIIVKIIVGGN